MTPALWRLSISPLGHLSLTGYRVGKSYFGISVFRIWLCIASSSCCDVVVSLVVGWLEDAQGRSRSC